MIGVLYADWEEPRRFSENDVQILELFRDQAAIAIGKAQLFEQIEDQLVIQDTLSQLGGELAALE